MGSSLRLASLSGEHAWLGLCAGSSAGPAGGATGSMGSARRSLSGPGRTSAAGAPGSALLSVVAATDFVSGFGDVCSCFCPASLGPSELLCSLLLPYVLGVNLYMLTAWKRAGAENQWTVGPWASVFYAQQRE